MNKFRHQIALVLLVSFFVGTVTLQIHALEHGLHQAKLRAENPHAGHAHDSAGWELDFGNDELCASCALVSNQAYQVENDVEKIIFAQSQGYFVIQNLYLAHKLIKRGRAPPAKYIS